MKRRRNGGDPALNAILAEKCGAHFKRMWEKPEFRQMQSEMSRQKMLTYMSDEQRRSKRDETNRKVMGRAARRLRKDPGFSEIMSLKTSEYMMADPYRPMTHDEYPAYLSMILSRVNNDPEVRAFCDSRMSELLKDELEKHRASRPPNPASPASPEQPTPPDAA